MKNIFVYLFAVSLTFAVAALPPAYASDNRYVGAKACKACHENEYNNFIKYSKKANSFNNIKKMQKKLTPQEYRSCYECHTTGYGRPSGFVSESETPDLEYAGCEVCHGPGGNHIDSEDPDDIISVIEMDECKKCHDSSRIVAFDFKPLIYSSAH